MVQLALRRPYTFIVMAMLIVLATPFVLLRMATDIFPEINIPVISIIWNYGGLPAQEMGQRIAGQTERGMTTTVTFTDRGDGTTEVVTHQTDVPEAYRTPEARAGFATSLDRFDAYVAGLAGLAG